MMNTRAGLSLAMCATAFWGVLLGTGFIAGSYAGAPVVFMGFLMLGSLIPHSWTPAFQDDMDGGL